MATAAKTTIYETLKADHRKLLGLLRELVLVSDSSEVKHQLIDQIRDELVPHSRAEEAVLYNSMRMLDSTKDLGWHGYAEHMAAETLLRTLQAKDKLDMDFYETAKKLKESLEHHIEEEEEKMFSASQQVFTEEEAVAMAETFEAMKPEIREEGLMKTTLDMVANMMPPRLSDKFRAFDITQQ